MQSPATSLNNIPTQNIDAGEERGEVESHDESNGGESMEIPAVWQDYSRAGHYHVRDKKGWISPVVIRDPAIDEATCGQSVHTQERVVAKVTNIKICDFIS